MIICCWTPSGGANACWALLNENSILCTSASFKLNLLAACTRGVCFCFGSFHQWIDAIKLSMYIMCVTFNVIKTNRKIPIITFYRISIQFGIFWTLERLLYVWKLWKYVNYAFYLNLAIVTLSGCFEGWTSFPNVSFQTHSYFNYSKESVKYDSWSTLKIAPYIHDGLPEFLKYHYNRENGMVTKK